MKLYLNKGKHKKRRPIQFDFTGQKIFNISIIKRIENHDTKCATRVAWRCKCDCGTIFNTTTRKLRRGQKSCGCLSRYSRFKDRTSLEDMCVNYKYSQYKNKAKRGNLSFNLSRGTFKNFIFGNCYYCGQAPVKKIHHFKQNKDIIYWNGIDRVNNNKGYYKGNCVSCCHICNRAKGILTKEEFISWIGTLINYRKRF